MRKYNSLASKAYTVYCCLQNVEEAWPFSPQEALQHVIYLKQGSFLCNWYPFKPLKLLLKTITCFVFKFTVICRGILTLSFKTTDSTRCYSCQHYFKSILWTLEGLTVVSKVETGWTAAQFYHQTGLDLDLMKVG